MPGDKDFTIKEGDNFAKQEYNKNIENRKQIIERIKVLKKNLEDLGVPNDMFPVNIVSSDTSDQTIYVDEEYIESSDKVKNKGEAIKLCKEWEAKTAEFIALKKKMMNEFGYGGGPVERDGSIPGVDY